MVPFAVLIGRVAGVLAAVAFLPYIVSILRGRTTPNRATWAIWSMAGIILASSYYASGARSTVWVAISYAIFYVIVFLLSLKYGVGGYAKLDIICLTGAIVGLLAWIAGRDPVTALYIMAVINLLGTVPTIRKVYRSPESENRLAWSMDVIASILNLFAITSFSLHILVYPITALLGNTAIVLLLFVPRRRLLPTPAMPLA